MPSRRKLGGTCNEMVIGGLCVLLSALTTHGQALMSASSCESLKKTKFKTATQGMDGRN